MKQGASVRFWGDGLHSKYATVYLQPAAYASYIDQLFVDYLCPYHASRVVYFCGFLRIVGLLPLLAQSLLNKTLSPALQGLKRRNEAHCEGLLS